MFGKENLENKGELLKLVENPILLNYTQFMTQIVTFDSQTGVHSTNEVDFPTNTRL